MLFFSFFFGGGDLSKVLKYKDGYTYPLKSLFKFSMTKNGMIWVYFFQVEAYLKNTFTVSGKSTCTVHMWDQWALQNRNYMKKKVTKYDNIKCCEGDVGTSNGIGAAKRVLGQKTQSAKCSRNLSRAPRSQDVPASPSQHSLFARFLIKKANKLCFISWRSKQGLQAMCYKLSHPVTIVHKHHEMCKSGTSVYISHLQ